MANMFAQIDSAIDDINSVKTYLDNAFIAVQDKTQEYIDEVIEEDINPYVNAKLAKIRELLLKSLQQQYQAFQSLSSLLSPIESSSPTDLGKVIEFCMAVKDFLVGAYSSLMQFMTQLTISLARLTDAITGIVTYTPPIQGISFSKLNIQMEPIRISDITG